MIKKYTVFILGAGASKPYGYPTGPELIAKMLNLKDEVARVIQECGTGADQWRAFQDSLRKSSQGSIDAFLERRPDLRGIGKLLIAANILHCENESAFYVSDDHW